ncbi:Glycosyl transferases group 1 [Caulifigura coniformis]|uniref:Glycosyl transferases group 1 n=1 Tax=Caulifigura coniformis TaxID=2527983 RepID=A0A517SI95_9PLAN|nr:glycosyltransferase family 1 protein [Caulifigura coniformis]QDT55846.1 Glycosyl transferases group 1 [Caulifigura coniformis]
MSGHRIGVVLQGGAQWVGGLEYTRNLILAISSAARELSSPVSMSLLHRPGETGNVEAFKSIPDVSLMPEDLSVDHLLSVRIARKLGLRVRNKGLAAVSKREGFRFVFPFDGTRDDAGTDSAAWIPDLQHFRLPQYFEAHELRLRDWGMKRIADNAPMIIVSSEAVKKDLEAFSPGVAPKVRVVRFRVSVPKETFSRSPAETVAKYHLPERFLLVSNQFWVHKNHLGLLEALKIAVERRPGICVAMTGRLHDARRPAYGDEVLSAVQRLGLHANVRLLGLIPKSDQLQLLRGCCGLVQPSLFEGWNTGVEEARALGKVIVASDIAVHREQAAPECVYFDPSLPQDFADQLLRVFDSQAPLSVEGEQAAVDAYRRLVVEYGKEFLGLSGLGVA